VIRKGWTAQGMPGPFSLEITRPVRGIALYVLACPRSASASERFDTPSFSMPLFIHKPKRTDGLGLYFSSDTSGTGAVFSFGTSGTGAVLRLPKSRNGLLPQKAIWFTLTYITDLNLATEF
jgi:hypothetical protein